jgi:hypothetical protein
MQVFEPGLWENRRLNRDEPVAFENELVGVRNFRGYIDHFRGFYRIHLRPLKAEPEDVNM